MSWFDLLLNDQGYITCFGYAVTIAKLGGGFPSIYVLSGQNSFEVSIPTDIDIGGAEDQQAGFLLGLVARANFDVALRAEEPPVPGGVRRLNDVLIPQVAVPAAAADRRSEPSRSRSLARSPSRSVSRSLYG